MKKLTRSGGLDSDSRQLFRAILRSMVVLAGLFCLALPGLADEQVFVRTYKLPAGGHFQLDNVNGSVKVEGWDKDEVEVRAVKTGESDPQELDRVKIEIQSQPGEVDVHTLYPQDEGADVAVEYEVHVPNRVLLNCIGTINGSVRVSGIDGSGDLRSVNGDVEVTSSSGRFSAKTTNGDLHLDLRKVQGDAPMNLETVNGSVYLGLPHDAHAQFAVRSMNGEFQSDIPVTSTVAAPGSRGFRGRLGRGGALISMRTVNGGIRLVVDPPGV